MLSATLQVPLLPFIPVISMFINVYLMMQLDRGTWIRFAIWMVLGEQLLDLLKSLSKVPQKNLFFTFACLSLAYLRFIGHFHLNLHWFCFELSQRSSYFHICYVLLSFDAQRFRSLLSPLFNCSVLIMIHLLRFCDLLRLWRSPQRPGGDCSLLGDGDDRLQPQR